MAGDPQLNQIWLAETSGCYVDVKPFSGNCGLGRPQRGIYYATPQRLFHVLCLRDLLWGKNSSSRKRWPALIWKVLEGNVQRDFSLMKSSEMVKEVRSCSAGWKDAEPSRLHSTVEVVCVWQAGVGEEEEPGLPEGSRC